MALMADLDRLLGRMTDRLFDDAEARLAELFDFEFDDRGITLSPTRYTVTKAKDGVVIVVEVPGLTHKDIEVTLADAIITVVGKGEPVKGQQVHIEKKFRVNAKTDMSDIVATVKNGLLTITVKRDKQPDLPKGKVTVGKGS